MRCHRSLKLCLATLVGFAAASCSSPAPQVEAQSAQQSQTASAAAQGRGSTNRPQVPSQLQDSGTPAGPHMLGPLSPQPSELPPDYAVIRLDPNAQGLDVCR